MTHYVGLDISMKTTFICIVNEKGKVVKELESLSTPEAIDSCLSGTELKIEKVKSGKWLFNSLLIKGP